MAIGGAASSLTLLSRGRDGSKPPSSSEELMQAERLKQDKESSYSDLRVRWNLTTQH
eukprot:CAMPEP_0202375498 /NCGR_PEP_ID=MMETSP1127-20130417/6173_1 /ASSEMBLY_ACC=CAM_ASM_000462 /TAXON_ID=3047 /ORGANISM="Dunaliella tertiolecta, Strain CCMP1320" /LENGTH=56 /DNA_ID=CAMNT_0048973001 /DNA_START=296 /DNA_END=466 /DNA_ORIENTATION=+